MENRSRYQVLLSEHEKTIQELQLEHSKLLTAYAALEFVVRHDSLTKLPNRKELDRRIKKDITSEDTQAVFMIFDLRRFKYINDSYGHEV
jgi:GGDEF domain-containing protein